MKHPADTFTAMKNLIKHTTSNQGGFTLVELVVVIAILGVMAAIAVPMVNNFLGSSKEQAYAAEMMAIQVSVDAFRNNPANVRFTGRRQFPIIGANKNSGAFIQPDENTEAQKIAVPIEGNPRGGTMGGSPKWVDDADGIRETSEDDLNDEDSVTASGWYVAIIERQGTRYIADSRDYFIDFSQLVDAGLLEKPPASASLDNIGGSETGSYSWYVDQSGRVKSLPFFYPESNQTGYQAVFP